MPKSGCLNWVIFITFDDGVEWVFRSPRSDLLGFYSDETASKILVSEASTLMFLKANTSIPVPEVYSFSGSSDNDIGVPYIVQSKAPGRSLGSYNWCKDPHEMLGAQHQPRLPLSDKDREKVMKQLGAIMSELSDHRLEEIGSLTIDETRIPSIGECLSPSFTWQERDSLELDRGPFSEEFDYLDSLVSAFTSHARELPLTPHVFIAPVPDKLDYKTMDSYRTAGRRWNDFVTIGQKTDHSRNVLSYCIAGQFLREMIPNLSSGIGQGFALSHPDLHLGNLYVDDDFNITCVIDWSSTTSGPITELLVPPSLGSSNVPASGFLAAAFRTGFEQRATKAASNISCSNLWKASEKMWYFSRLTGLLSKNDYEHFRRLYELAYETNTGEDGSAKGILWLFHERANQDENKRLLAELEEDDITMEELQEKERAWFIPSRTANSDAVAVARKLTLMSEMNPGLLADHRLWQWVEDARKQDIAP
ncbi:hypothetical protein S40288_03523 [Stachybotrys chartarum IBT 40288]|nr:hypothetical protein S40288_03523 [Stachybotrys chartarum IBT 40288]